MNIHAWARQALDETVQAGRQAGFDEPLLLRALLGVLVERSSQIRAADDLRAELLFLADNLDDQRDYSFMRP